MSRSFLQGPIAEMKLIAHRGAMNPEIQNTPAGVELARNRSASYVELDVTRRHNGKFHCVHGLGKGAALQNCLAVMGGEMELIAHLKGNFDEMDLLRLIELITAYLPLERTLFAAHGSKVLQRLRRRAPHARLARFGFVSSIVGLIREQPWEACIIHQLVLTRWHVTALQKRGFKVFASCVWELRSRQGIEQLGVDGSFVNFHQKQTVMDGV